MKSITRFTAGNLVRFLIGCLLASAMPVRAATYTWTNSASLFGYWTNSANWSPVGLPGTVASDNAYLTNQVALAYTNLLDSKLSASLGTLAISNALGEAWLIITNNAAGTGVFVTNTTFSLGSGGRLQIDSGAVVTGITTLTLLGTNGVIYLNNGGKLFTSSAAKTIGAGGSVTGLVTSASGAGNGGFWNFNTAALTIGAASGHDNVIRIADGAVVTNVGALTITGNRNSLLATNGGRIYGAGAIVFSATAGQFGNTIDLGDGLWNLNTTALNVGSAAGASNNTFTSAGTVTGANGLSVGIAAGANNNTVIVTNGGFFMTAAGAIAIGSTAAGAAGGHNNTAILSNSVLWGTGGGTAASIGSASSNNTLTLLGTTVWNNNAGTLNIGGQSGGFGFAGSNNSLTVSGALLTNFGLVSVGGRAFATGNQLIIENGGILSNFAGLIVGFGAGANGNSVIVTNDSRVFMTGGSISIGAVGLTAGGYNNTVIISNSVLNGTAASFLGTVSSNNTLTLLDTVWRVGATPALGGLTIGALGGSNNVLTLGGSVISNLGMLIIGGDLNSRSNRIIVNGSVLSNVTGLAVGSGGASSVLGADYNSLIVTSSGSGLFMTSAGTIDVGGMHNANPGGSGNTVILSNSVLWGSLPANGGASIGNGSSNNILTLLDNTVWNNNGGTLSLGGNSGGSGAAGTNNVLTVSGALLTNFSLVSIGGRANAARNQMLIQNGGSLSNVTSVVVGNFSGATGNSLIVSNGASLFAGATIIGASGGTNNLFKITGASTVTLASLNVNPTNTILFEGGVLNLGGTSSITNFQAGAVANFTIGDGTQIARLSLTGNATLFANGIAIANNGTLSGVGTVTAPVTGMLGSAIIASNGNLTLAGAVSGASTIRADQSGTLTLRGVNTFTTNLLITGGTLVFTNNNNLGATDNQISFDTGALQTGVGLTNGRTITLGAGGGSLDVVGGQTTWWTGQITGVGSLMKVGGGTLVLSNANTFSGGLIANQGTVQGWAQPGQATGPFGDNANSISVGYPTITATNATVILNGQAGTPTITTNGDLIAGGTFNGGTLTVNAASGGGYTTLQLSNLVRTGRATLIIAPGTGGLAVSNRITFIGDGSNLVNNLLPVWLVANNNSGDFLTYGANGVTNTTYVASFGTGNIVNNSVLFNLPSDQEAYALKLTANVNLNGNTLTLGDGTTAGLIFANGTAITNGGTAASLDFGTAEGVAYLGSGNTGTISVDITGTGGLTKFGGGALVISNSALYSGDTWIEGGTLTLVPTADIIYSNSINGGGSFVKGGTKSLTVVGSTGALYSVTIANGGSLTLSDSVMSNRVPVVLLGAGTGLVITNSQFIYDSVSGTTTIGNGVSNQFVRVLDNGLWNLNGQALTVGSGAATGNVFTVMGGTVTNAGLIAVGSNGAGYNSLLVTNANLWSSGLNIGNNGNSSLGATNNSVTVLANTVWDLRGDLATALVIGSDGLTAISNSLIVNGGVMSNIYWVSVGGGTGGGPQNGSYSSLLITNGGVMALRDSGNGSFNIGFGAGSNNTFTVTGTGSVLKTVSPTFGTGFYVGTGSGISNNMIIANGGQVLIRSGTPIVGNGAGSNSVLITGAGSVWSNSLNSGGGGAGYGFAIGVNTSGNSIIISNGGALYNVGGLQSNDGNMLLGSGAASQSNRVLVTGSGSVWSNANVFGSSLTIGSAGGAKYNSLTVADGGKYFGNGFVTIGNSSGANSNSFNLGSAGLSSFASNGAVYVGGLAGANFNTLTVTNATLVSNGGTIGSGASSNAASVLAGGTWNLMGQPLNVGSLSTAYGNNLTVNGGILTNVGQVGLGGTSNTLLITGGSQVFATNIRFAGSNVVTITGPGSVWNSSGYVAVGNRALLVVADGGQATFTQIIPGQFDTGAGTNGTILVTGLGSKLTATTSLWLGLTSSSNYVTVADQAGLVTPYTVIGGGGGGTYLDNIVTVTGGATLTNTSNSGGIAVKMGDNGTQIGSQLIVSDGGMVVNVNGSTVIGTGNAGTSNNSILVTGIGSVYSNVGAMTVGSIRPLNSLTVTNGGQLFSGAVIVGSGSGASTNRLTVTDGGQLFGASVTVGTAAGANNNAVLVNGGGLLEANTLSNFFGGVGNTISNVAGTYQFTTNPIVAPNGSGNIALTDGTISFRATGSASVATNAANQINNIRFAGANTFALNNASNTAATVSQTYTFDTVGGNPSNYVRLVMVNGPTAYANANGADITIGSSGSFLASNTLATIAGTFTNNGTADIVDATVNFQNALHVAGTLTLRNGFVTGVGAKTIAGTLRGNGSIVGDATVSGVITPGFSLGTLVFSNNLTLTGSYQAEFGDAGSDQVIVIGILTLTGATLDLTQVGGATSNAFVIASYGTLAGDAVFATTTGLPAGYVIDYMYNGNQIAIVVVPEPGALALVGLGLVLLIVAGRHRHSSS